MQPQPVVISVLRSQDALLDDIAALSGLAKGDLLVFDGSDLVELGVGSNGQHLEADSVQSTGLKWASPSGGGGSSPTGAVIGFAGSSAPSGWLLCDGSAVSRTTYADLFTAIGTSYGVGDGSTTFNLPDLRGRVPVGVGQGSGLTNRALAARLWRRRPSVDRS